MALDYNAIYGAIYARAATDADGAAVRALVGGASSIFPAHQLGNIAGLVFPWLVWRRGAVGGQGGDQRNLAGVWTIYAPLSHGPRPLYAIGAALETLYGYTNRLAIAGGELVSNGVGSPFFDEAVGASGLQYTVTFLQRG